VLTGSPLPHLVCQNFTRRFLGWQKFGLGHPPKSQQPIAAPIVGGMITATIHVLILVPVFFMPIKRRALRRGVLLDTLN
jgi:hypothetical protein